MESSTITYKVEIAASKRKLETRPYNFKGLADVSREARNNMYRYYYGEVTNYNAAKTLRAEAVQAGDVNSFIVAYRDGVRIALDDALKSSSD